MFLRLFVAAEFLSSVRAIMNWACEACSVCGYLAARSLPIGDRRFPLFLAMVDFPEVEENCRVAGVEGIAVDELGEEPGRRDVVARLEPLHGDEILGVDDRLLAALQFSLAACAEVFSPDGEGLGVFLLTLVDLAQYPAGLRLLCVVFPAGVLQETLERGHGLVVAVQMELALSDFQPGRSRQLVFGETA